VLYRDGVSCQLKDLSKDLLPTADVWSKLRPATLDTMLNISFIHSSVAKAALAATAQPYLPMLVADERRCGTARTLAERLMR
jgi:hypothetical protein